MASWESSKENVQPLRHGRKSKCLTSLIQPTEQDVARLMEERQKFEEEILAESNATDPMDAWDRYLNWTLQNFPESSSNFFQELLTKFVSKFSKLERYKCDPRLVNAWLLWCDRVDDPLALFSYMHTNNIGVTCVSLYVAWADKYEMSGDMKHAEMIYKKAEKANAQPYQYLRQMQSQFELRFARSIMQKNNQSDESVVTNNIYEDVDTHSQPRAAMTQLRGVGQRRKVGTQRTGIVVATDNYSLQTSKGLQPSQNANAPKFEIYNENEQSGGSVPGFHGNWSHQPNPNSNNSENMQKPGMWNSTKKIKQKHRSTSLSSKCVPQKEMCFDVYMDEEEEDVHPQHSRRVACNVEQILRTRDKSKQTATNIMQMINGPPQQEAGKLSMYDVDKVYNVMGEMEFQQIRAAYWRFKQKNNTPVNHLVEDVQRLDVSSHEQIHSCTPKTDAVIEANIESAPTQHHEIPSSPTLHTKAVTDEVLSWLQGPIPTATEPESSNNLPFSIFSDEPLSNEVNDTDHNCQPSIITTSKQNVEMHHSNIREVSASATDLPFTIYNDVAPQKSQVTSSEQQQIVQENNLLRASAVNTDLPFTIYSDESEDVSYKKSQSTLRFPGNDLPGSMPPGGASTLPFPIFHDEPAQTNTQQQRNIDPTSKQALLLDLLPVDNPPNSEYNEFADIQDLLDNTNSQEPTNDNFMQFFG